MDSSGAFGRQDGGRGLFFDRPGRESERDRLLRSRRRAKVDRLLRSMRGIHIVGAERKREEAIARVMLEYDSGEDVAEQTVISLQSQLLTFMHPTLDEQQRRQQQIQLAAAQPSPSRAESGAQNATTWGSPSQLQVAGSSNGRKAGDRHFASGRGEEGGNFFNGWAEQQRNQQHQSQQQQQQSPPSGHGSSYGERGYDPSHNSAPSGSELHRGTSSMHKTGTGSKIDTAVLKYMVPPVAPEDDPYLPHRNRVRVGELVDDWHVLQEMHARAGELGEKAYQEAQRGKQREYMEQLRRQEEEVKRRQQQQEQQKVVDREWLDSKVSKEREEASIEKKEKHRKAAALHDMYRSQEIAAEERRGRERAEKEREEAEILRKMREDVGKAEKADESRKREARERAEKQKDVMMQQLSEADRAKQMQRLEDAEYAIKYEARLAAEDDRRKEVERKRAERIGKLEIMSNDNADREKHRRMEEDRRFLEGISKEQMKREAIERQKMERLAREKSDYATYLTGIMHRRQLDEKHAREVAVAQGEQELKDFRSETIKEKEEAMRKKEAEQKSYREDLRGQITAKGEKDQLQYRMSEKEREINTRTFESYVEAGRNPNTAGRTPIVPDMHNFAYPDAFQSTASAAKQRTPSQYHQSSPQGGYSGDHPEQGGYRQNLHFSVSPPHDGQNGYAQAKYSSSPHRQNSYEEALYPSSSQGYGHGYPPQQYQSPPAQRGYPDQYRKTPGDKDGWQMQSRDSPMSRGHNGGRDNSKLSPMAGSAERNFFV